ncbi:MAG: hypothetical protein VX026_04805 [Myxococcota bacterium]|nr:hypothetical protein [Myxococcota bacterium]
MIVISLLFQSCLLTEPTSSQSYTWGGYLYQRFADTEELLPVDNATLTLTYSEQNETISAFQPYEDTQGYWQFELYDAAPEEMQIRIETPNSSPMLWRGQTPASQSIWLNLFTHHDDYNSLFFEQINTFITDEIQELSQGEVSHLWGTPLTPDDWIGGEAQTIHVDDNSSHQVFFFGLDENLELVLLEQPLISPPLYFFSPNIPPGQVLFEFESPTAYGQTDYSTNGGEILSAMYYVLWPN